MDPATILTTIDTCMTIAKVTVTGLQSLFELKTKYENVKINVGDMISKVRAIQFSLSLLKNWARFGEGKNADKELVDQLGASIKAVSWLCLVYIMRSRLTQLHRVSRTS